MLFRVKEDHVHVSCVYSLKVLKACCKLFPDAAILNLIEIRRAGNERYDDSAKLLQASTDLIQWRQRTHKGTTVVQRTRR